MRHIPKSRTARFLAGILLGALGLFGLNYFLGIESSRPTPVPANRFNLVFEGHYERNFERSVFKACPTWLSWPKFVDGFALWSTNQSGFDEQYRALRGDRHTSYLFTVYVRFIGDQGPEAEYPQQGAYDASHTVTVTQVLEMSADGRC